MSRTSFDVYLAEVEAAMTDDERAELDAWREHFRRDLPPDSGVREPVRPSPDAGSGSATEEPG